MSTRLRHRKTAQRAFWHVQFTRHNEPVVVVFRGYPGARTYCDNLSAPWIKGKQVVGPVYYEVIL
jgi:hypothetical protein